jgi:hypothetical protein
VRSASIQTISSDSVSESEQPMTGVCRGDSEGIAKDATRANRDGFGNLPEN